jgi:DNA polymerase-1
MRDVEMPLVEVLAEMEFAGVALDPAALQAMALEIRSSLETITREVHALAGREFNVGSPLQLAEVLYTDLGLPSGRRGKSGASSTAAEVLEDLRDRHPIVSKILEHRELTKLLSTYVEALPGLVNSRTGRIHTSFNQTVAATGRLSSSDPNLQNIPVKTELGRRIRKAFVTGLPDRLLLSADYSQIELRVLAHLSGDEPLLRSFSQEEDIHRTVAAALHGVRPEDVTAEMRRFAKTVNFGIVYGMTPFGLGKDLGIALEDAAEIIRAYFDGHPGVRAFIDETIARARETGFVRTILGRRRPIRDIRSRNPRMRAFAERTAVNSVVQGSAADLIKVAMNNIHTDLLERGSSARLLLQIHDELVLEVPAESLAIEEERIRAEMTGAMTLRVPIVVNTHSGKTWFDAKG